jgi:putative acetyltransferase
VSKVTVIRKGDPADLDRLVEVYRGAFPNEDLLPLVRRLLLEEQQVLSLVASLDHAVAGHIAFTPCTVSGQSGEVSLLGPLAVAPDFQRKGIGSALIHEGVRQLKAAGVVQVFVLGDPAFYGRFGFAANTDVSPPYLLPAKWHTAWQSVNLNDHGPLLRGVLRVPPAWQQPALWAE